VVWGNGEEGTGGRCVMAVGIWGGGLLDKRMMRRYSFRGRGRGESCDEWRMVWDELSCE
jgi:hypothetical protein